MEAKRRKEDQVLCGKRLLYLSAMCPYSQKWLQLFIPPPWTFICKIQSIGLLGLGRKLKGLEKVLCMQEPQILSPAPQGLLSDAQEIGNAPGHCQMWLPKTPSISHFNRLISHQNLDGWEYRKLDKDAQGPRAKTGTCVLCESVPKCSYSEPLTL